MRKTLISVAVVSVAIVAVSGAIYMNKKKQVSLVPVCPTDEMMCPDGTTVARKGAACEFGTCKQELQPYMTEKAPSVTIATSTSSPQILPITPVAQEPQITTNLFKKIKESASAIFKKTTTSLSNDVATGLKDTSTTAPKAAAPVVANVPPPLVNEIRYIIEKGKIITSEGVPVYTLPIFNNSSTGETASTTHLVNVVPVPGAIPVDGLPGKYYLSENYFSGNEECKFANRIYILDVRTNTRTLMHEENSTTLSSDDPRSCNNEMYLLATETNKLILKYHTLDTNMTCDSTWSEPEKTWYLSIDQPETATKRYYIIPELYTKAEASEEACRTLLEATSSQP